MADLIELNEDNFKEQVLQASEPVLVDFTATWCAPCHQLAPIVEEIALENAPQLKVGKLDTDANASVPMQYGVMGLPTLILFKDGEPVERLQGFKPKPTIMQKISPHLG